jgi:hypothetical protein
MSYMYKHKSSPVADISVRFSIALDEDAASASVLSREPAYACVQNSSRSQAYAFQNLSVGFFFFPSN